MKEREDVTPLTGNLLWLALALFIVSFIGAFFQ